MSAKTKVAKVRCRCTGGKLENPCDPSLSAPLTPLARAWRAGWESALQFVRTPEGLKSLIGTPGSDGLVLAAFCWGVPNPPRTLREFMKGAPTYGALLRREEAEKGGQH